MVLFCLQEADLDFSKATGFLTAEGAEDAEKKLCIVRGEAVG